MDNQNTNNAEQRLWRFARRRVEFKRHFIVYIFVNLFLWCLWAFTGSKYGNNFIPWPAFVSFFWGIGLIFNFLGAYSGIKDSMIEHEYQKLLNKNS